MSIITLMTDFGITDGYVGTVKGVILSINPKVTLIDITHKIPSYGIDDAAFILRNASSFFPDGTVHLAVVDPGVGGDRRAIVVQTDKHFFVSPDNGILSYILDSQKILRIIEIENPKYWLHPVSSTFHTRDIFAPVAAHLTRGIRLNKIGSSVKNPKTFKISRPVYSKRSIKGQVVYIDHFGNLITNISKKNSMVKVMADVRVHIAGCSISGISSHYGTAPKDELTFLEVASREGNAQKILKAAKGTPVLLEFRKSLDSSC
jgi:S-adenosylmethionine hydrolase